VDPNPEARKNMTTTALTKDTFEVRAELARQDEGALR